MSGNISRRSFLISAPLAAMASSGFAANLDRSLRPVLRPNGHDKRAISSVEEILLQKKLSGRLAYVVADSKSGKLLEGRGALRGLPPASVTKSLTALYALQALGANHRFKTELLATGGVENGEILGDLILLGGGDPTLDTDALAEMARTLKTSGINRVRGDFLVYDAALPVLDRIDPDQPDHVGYNPGLSGIALNYNRVHFEWRRSDDGYDVTMDARTQKYRPEVAMAVMQIADRNAPVFTYRDGKSRDSWSVARGALGKGGSRWLPVRKPALYAGDVFATLARAQGVALAQPKVTDAVAGGDVLVTHRSEVLRTILKGMLKYSNNLTADMVGLSASRARGARPRTLADSAAQMNAWLHDTYGMTRPGLVDHSGLGDRSRLSARDMVRALVAVQGDGFRDILKPIALRDEKGKPVKDHPIKVLAKTGTLNFVSTLAGYTTGPNGADLTFAIFAADEDIRAGITRQDREAPRGGKAWNKRAKRVQQALIERWIALYGEKAPKAQVK